jgi:hypothetical protein
MQRLRAMQECFPESEVSDPVPYVQLYPSEHRLVSLRDYTAHEIRDREALPLGPRRSTSQEPYQQTFQFG